MCVSLGISDDGPSAHGVAVHQSHFVCLSHQWAWLPATGTLVVCRDHFSGCYVHVRPCVRDGSQFAMGPSETHMASRLTGVNGNPKEGFFTDFELKQSMVSVGGWTLELRQVLAVP